MGASLAVIRLVCHYRYVSSSILETRPLTWLPARQSSDSVSERAAGRLCILTLSSGITTDLLVYSAIIPVLPFQLEHLSYHRVSSLTGWLLFAYVRSIVMLIHPLTHTY